jgi:transcriptional regulator with XRE-family HTH domain
MAKSKYPAEAKVIGEKLRSARHKARLSQTALARATDLDVAVISRLERGCHSPTIHTLTVLASGLSVPLGRLLP